MKDARNIIHFIKSPFGKFIMLFVVLLLLLVISPFLRSMLSAATPKQKNFTIKEAEGSVTMNPGKFNPGDNDVVVVKSSTTSAGADKQQSKSTPDFKVLEELKTQEEKQAPGKSSNGSESKKTVNITPLDLYTAKSQKTEMPMKDFAPYGRLIPCELVNTIDSANTETPIIGLVTENIYNEGKLLIPAGTEVHGSAQSTPIRDHIATGNSWVLVWRTKNGNNGKELRIKGIALEDGRMAGFEGRKWSLTDGSAGIKGYTVDNRQWTELKAIALKMLSGIGQGMYKNNIVGMAGGGAMVMSGGTWKDSLGKGLEESADLYADIMLSKILKDGFFVRCPAGTTFYLYVEQTIDLRKAEIAGSIVPVKDNQQKEKNVYSPQRETEQQYRNIEAKKLLLENYLTDERERYIQ